MEFFKMKEKVIKQSIKIKIENFDELINKLRRNGCIFLGGGLETIKRYDTIEKKYEKKGIYFRKIDSDFQKCFEVKEKIDDDELIRSRLDTEIEIENVEKMEYILKLLGCNYIRIMEKYTQTWKYYDATIILDELKFGNYITIEGNLEKIEEFCKEFQIDINNKLLVTYWEIFDDMYNEKDILFEKGYVSKML